MPKRCSVCIHKKRTEIDAAVLTGEASRSVAKRFGVSEWALTRHRLHHHILQSLVKASEIKEIAAADTLLGQLKALQQRATNLLVKAEASGDYRGALAGIREARECITVLARIVGEIKEAPAVLIQQQFVLGPDKIGEALKAMLDCGAITISEGEYRELEEGEPEKRQESVAVEGDDMSRGKEVSRDDPKMQIG